MECPVLLSGCHGLFVAVVLGGKDGRGKRRNGTNWLTVAQSCLTLCNPRDCSPPGSSVHGILQARIFEWLAIPFSRGSSPPRGSCIGRQVLYCLPRGRELWIGQLQQQGLRQRYQSAVSETGSFFWLSVHALSLTFTPGEQGGRVSVRGLLSGKLAALARVLTRVLETGDEDVRWSSEMDEMLQDVRWSSPLLYPAVCVLVLLRSTVSAGQARVTC